MRANTPSFIVIYGSATRWVEGVSRVSPRDVDVVFGGTISEADATVVVQQWAQQVGLQGLPLDLRRSTAFREQDGLDHLELPTFPGCLRAAIILRGDVVITWREETGLTSQLRRLEFDGLGQLALAYPKGMRLVLTDGDEADRTAAYEGEGLVALRSALRHVPEQTLDFLAVGPLLRALAEHGTQHIPMGVWGPIQRSGPCGGQYPTIEFGNDPETGRVMVLGLGGPWTCAEFTSFVLPRV